MTMDEAPTSKSESFKWERFTIMVQRKKFKNEKIIKEDINIEKLLSYETAKGLNLLNWKLNLKKRIISTKALKNILKYKLKNGE